jgi:hypothetical protein
MRKIKIFSLLFLFSILCSSVFAESKKGEIKTFFKEYKEMVSLAEKAAKKESVPDMAKVEGLMAKLSVKYATLVVSDDWTEKNTKEYKKLTERYGKAHKVFGKGVGKEIGSTAKEFGKDIFLFAVKSGFQYK